MYCILYTHTYVRVPRVPFASLWSLVVSLPVASLSVHVGELYVWRNIWYKHDDFICSFMYNLKTVESLPTSVSAYISQTCVSCVYNQGCTFEEFHDFSNRNIARDITGCTRWSTLKDNWSRFLWRKRTKAAVAACLQKMQASLLLMVAVCWTNHSVLQDILLLVSRGQTLTREERVWWLVIYGVVPAFPTEWHQSDCSFSALPW